MNKTPNTGNESPASVTYSITSRDGFNALFTLREETGEALLQKMAVVEGKLLALLYKPQLKPVFGAKKEIQYVEGKVCPKDGAKLKKIISRKDGKEYWSCDNGKYDPITKAKSGCDFFTSPENFDSLNKTAKTGQDWASEYGEPH